MTIKNRQAKFSTEKKTASNAGILTEKTFADKAMYAALVIFAVIAAVMVFKGTSLYGPGISSDTVNYISTAEHLRDGKGYYNYCGKPYTHWPPLFPTLLGLLGLTGVEPIEVARYLNTVSFALIVFLSGLIFKQRLKSRLLILSGAAAVLLLPSMLRISAYAWTEPLFAVLVILFMFSIVRFLETARIKFVILAGLFTALACLQRYAGFPIIITGAALIFLYMRKSSVVDRFKYSVIFGIISCVPVGAWLIRNKIVASTFTEYRLHLDTSFYQEITKTLDSLTTWFVTPKISLPARLVIVAVFILLLIAAVLLRRRIAGRQQHTAAMLVKASAVLLVIYTVFTLTAAVYANANAEHRIFAPVYMFILLLMLIGLEDVGMLLGLVLKRQWAGHLVVACLCVVWLVSYQLPIVRQKMSYYLKYGVPGCNSIHWQRSPAINWLKTNKDKLDGNVFSNEPYPVYLHSGIIARMSPTRHGGFDKFRELMSDEEKNYLVWYKRNWRKYLYDLKEINENFRLKLIKHLPDALILEIQ